MTLPSPAALYARANLAPGDPVVVIGATVARFVVDVLLAKGIAPLVVVAAGAASDQPGARGSRRAA